MMSNELLNDTRFQYLVDLGFSVFEINNQLAVWCKGVIDYACEDYLVDTYKDNLSVLKEKEYDEVNILYLFFVHSDSFAIDKETFKKRISCIEKELGPTCEKKLMEDFWETGESRIFELVGWLTNDHTEWTKKIKEEKPKMKRMEE